MWNSLLFSTFKCITLHKICVSRIKSWRLVNNAFFWCDRKEKSISERGGTCTCLCCEISSNLFFPSFFVACVYVVTLDLTNRIVQSMCACDQFSFVDLNSIWFMILALAVVYTFRAYMSLQRCIIKRKSFHSVWASEKETLLFIFAWLNSNLSSPVDCVCRKHENIVCVFEFG